MRERVLALVLVLSLLCSGVIALGWSRGVRVARHDHSSPCGIWARGLVVTNEWGEPRLELVYRSFDWHYGLATFEGTGTLNHWIGLGIYPGEEPASFHSRP